MNPYLHALLCVLGHVPYPCGSHVQFVHKQVRHDFLLIHLQMHWNFVLGLVPCFVFLLADVSVLAA
jgi:hypothetical protein